MSWSGVRVLLTGSTGFVGRKLAARLVEQGAVVTALVRDPSRAPEGVEKVVGDLGATDALATACRDNEIVIHSAARPADSGATADFYRDNVEGTLLLARAAVAAGCRRFVFLSSISTYGFRPPPVADESTDVTVANIGGSYPYAESKIVCEHLLPSFGIPELVIVRVGSVYGPGSFHWTERPVRVLRDPRIGMMLIDGGDGLHNYVYIDNVVDGLLLAAIHPGASGTFNMTDGVATYRDFFRYYGEMLGGRGRVRKVSRNQALALAWAAEQAAKLRGKPPLLTRIAVKLLCRRSELPSARAADVLGWRPVVTLGDGMAASAQWLADGGLLR